MELMGKLARVREDEDELWGCAHHAWVTSTYSSSPRYGLTVSDRLTDCARFLTDAPPFSGGHSANARVGKNYSKSVRCLDRWSGGDDG